MTGIGRTISTDSQTYQPSFLAMMAFNYSPNVPLSSGSCFEKAFSLNLRSPAVPNENVDSSKARLIPSAENEVPWYHTMDPNNLCQYDDCFDDFYHHHMQMNFFHDDPHLKEESTNVTNGSPKLTFTSPKQQAKICSQNRLEKSMDQTLILENEFRKNESWGKKKIAELAKQLDLTES